MNRQFIDYVMLVKAQYEEELLNKAHVVGVGIGVRTQDRLHDDEPCIVVMVDRLVPPSEQSPEDRIPTELDGVPVDIQEVGELYAY
jgi:hypothetical protein